MYKKFMISATLLALAALGANGWAQTRWPSQPVRVLVANSPGTATDVAARVYSDHLSRAANASVVVENRPGADGYIAAEQTAKSAPDGHTLFFASQSIFGIDPHIKLKMPVDPDRDFTHIAVMLDDTGASGVFLHPSVPANTMQELVAYAKANPGKVSYASIVPLFSMIGAWINKKSGVDLLEVKYKAAPQAYQDVLAGRVSIMLDAFGTMEQHVRAGKVRALAVTKALEDYPQIPTFTSLYPDYRQPAFIVLVGPPGMSAALTDQINRASAAVVSNPRFNQELAKLRWRNVEGARTPQETSELIRRARGEWGSFIREIGLKPE
jgi:tripartite-type tricarboxylate transporter receptor subunit TctC